MGAPNEWRGLAVTYGIVAAIQLDLAISLDAGWTVVFSAVLGLVAIACGVAARQTSRAITSTSRRRQPTDPNTSRADDVRNATNGSGDLWARR